MQAPKLLSFTSLLTGSMIVALSTLHLTKPVSAQLIEPPPGLPAPQTTTSGGSRPISRACVQSATPFTAIASRQSVGLTRHNRPTVWVYLPPTQAQTLEFSMFDQDRKGIYQTTIEINNRTGYVPIELPSSAPALNQNQPYYWTVALVCDPNERTHDWITGGWIQQQSIDSALQQQLNQATLTEQIRLIAKAGYWYEAVDAYLRLQQAKPNDPQLTQLWAELVRTGNLKGSVSQVN
ncbi:DUF928 domain-containing protein [Pseudanabaenaceae cyanobacterium LEGE 13415]|nr:DUF928 domain-containing protein [Pseudanabaenaceae cyanobacterium LEGE 13415]